MQNSINWSGPDSGPEFKFLMLGIVLLCASGMLSSIFPIVEIVMISLLILAGVTATIMLVRHVLKERRLDWEAFYGPLDEEETKET